MDFMEDQGRSPAGNVKGCHAQQEASQEMYNLSGNGHPVPFFGLVIKGLIMHKFLFIVKAQQGNAIAIDTFRTIAQFFFCKFAESIPFFINEYYSPAPKICNFVHG